MASKIVNPGVSQHYQRFAWGTVGLAVLVALGTIDSSGVPQPVGVADASPIVSVPVRLHSGSAPAAFNPADQSNPAESKGAAGDDESAAPAASPAVTPGETGLAAPKDAPQLAAGPDTASLGRLVAASRNRSGGVEQGDEPVRRLSD